MSVPRKCTRPAEALYWWVRHLKKVLLPAPLGPIRQRSSPSDMEKSTRSTATTPPEAHG